MVKRDYQVSRQSDLDKSSDFKVAAGSRLVSLFFYAEDFRPRYRCDAGHRKGPWETFQNKRNLTVHSKTQQKSGWVMLMCSTSVYITVPVLLLDRLYWKGKIQKSKLSVLSFFRCDRLSTNQQPCLKKAAKQQLCCDVGQRSPGSTVSGPCFSAACETFVPSLICLLSGDTCVSHSVNTHR